MTSPNYSVIIEQAQPITVDMHPSQPITVSMVLPATDYFTGSLPNHNILPGVQGGIISEYYHLTSAQYSGLTGGSNADTLHSHTIPTPTWGTLS